MHLTKKFGILGSLGSTVCAQSRIPFKLRSDSIVGQHDDEGRRVSRIGIGDWIQLAVGGAEGETERTYIALSIRKHYGGWIWDTGALTSESMTETRQ
jgi:hypothetical protein